MPPPTIRVSFAASISLLDPVACVAEHAHPRRVFARAVGRPGHLDVAEYAFRVRHDDGEAPVGGGEPGDSPRRAARVVRIGLGYLAAVVDVAHGDESLPKVFFLVENGPAFSVRGDNRDPAARHTLEEKRRALDDLDHYQPPLELLGAVAHEPRPVRRPRDQFLQRGHHLAAVAGAQRKSIASGEEFLELRKDFPFEQDGARQAAAAAEHVAIGEAAARGEAFEARQRGASGDEVRHVDVDRLESGAIECRGHLDLAVYALLAKNGNPGSCIRIDKDFFWIEGQGDGKPGIRGIDDPVEFFARALRVVAQRLHAPGGFAPDPLQMIPFPGEYRCCVARDPNFVARIELADYVRALAESRL